jgi:hypothetical protein
VVLGEGGHRGVGSAFVGCPPVTSRSRPTNRSRLAPPDGDLGREFKLSGDCCQQTYAFMDSLIEDYQDESDDFVSPLHTQVTFSIWVKQENQKKLKETAPKGAVNVYVSIEFIIHP